MSASTVRRALTRWLPAAIGWVALIVAVDLLVGVMIVPWSEDGTAGPGGVIPLADGTVPDGDERPSLPAMRDSPWAEEYWGEFTLLRGEYEPFSRYRSADAAGEYINISGGVRRSYQAPGADGPEVPEVWFLGGSTMFGEGQRDDHTIPSELARLAEAEGVLFRPINLGSLGATSWEGFNRLLVRLASSPAPDVVVTYEGINDVNVIAEQQVAGRDDLTLQPGHYSNPGDDDYGGADEGDGAIEALDRTWWERYRDTSAAGQVLHGVLGALVPPAGAQEQPVDPDVAERALLAADHIRRAQLLISDLADSEGFSTVFISQPWLSPEAGPLADALAPTTVDLSSALDGVPRDDIYIDGGHTNELGAQLVAQALWPHLRDALAQR